MSSLFFFYTLAFLALCIVTSVVAATAWYTSKRSLFGYACVLFVAYAAEMAEIFFNEYLWQNVAFPSAEYYEITHPILRTAIAGIAQACIWFIVLGLLERKGRLLKWGPVAIFVGLSLASIALIPEGSLQQWVYYSVRTFCVLGSLIYLAAAHARLPEGRIKTMLDKQKWALWIFIGLDLLVILEDAIVILILPASGDLRDLYLSERNFSENLFALAFAVFTLREAVKALSVRIREAPTPQNTTNLDRAIAEHMPHYKEKVGLSNRESEVMALVVEGKTNQEIAGELYLALGTVKTHVHNIMKKAGAESREALILGFWQVQ